MFFTGFWVFKYCEIDVLFRVINYQIPLNKYKLFINYLTLENIF